MCKITAILLLICGTISACSSNSEGPDNPPVPPHPDDDIVFYDDFDSFDFSVWSKETHPSGWTNQELQSYSPKQVSVGKDGEKSVLILTAERRNGSVVSGRVNSKGKKSFKYGKLEACIKLPSTANGLWPAFWMMGNNDKEWPACGEIDIMEMGDAEGIRTGNTSKRVNTAIHFGPDVARHQQEYYAANSTTDLQDGNYHIYAAEWDRENIRIYIDGTLFKTFDIKDNPYFHDQFFILFNLAVGGSFTGITDLSGITALKEGQKVSMYIDWIKISQTK